MTYSVSFIAHIRAIKECVRRFHGRASCDIETGVLEIRARERCVELLPQFALRHEGSLGYSRQLLRHAEFFVGWRPYSDRVWPQAQDKRTFKQFCVEQGLPTPRSWSQPHQVAANVLVKRSDGSFSRGISGPFSPEAVRSAQRRLEDGEYFEEFVRGDIVKAWYWNALPVALEVLPMPAVTGDGSATLRKLINGRRVAHLPGSDWTVWEAMAASQGMTLDSIAARGQRVPVDFRYLSPLHPAPPDDPNLNQISAYEDTALLRQLRAAGDLFYKAIPAHIRAGTLYTIDAIADAHHEATFLEMNCNPIVHPDAYLPMFESLFGAAGDERPVRPAPGRLKVAAAG